jgi:hypothetical protein
VWRRRFTPGVPSSRPESRAVLDHLWRPRDARWPLLMKRAALIAWRGSLFCTLLLSIVFLGSGCPARDNAYDQERCDPRCVVPKVCSKGQCVLLDAVTVDAAHADGPDARADRPNPDAPTPDAPNADGIRPEAAIPDTGTLDAPKSDAATTDAATTDGPRSDSPKPASRACQVISICYVSCLSDCAAFSSCVGECGSQCCSDECTRTGCSGALAPFGELKTCIDSHCLTVCPDHPEDCTWCMTYQCGAQKGNCDTQKC